MATIAIRAIALGGIACGLMDIGAAFVIWGLRGVGPVRVLQGIASGLLGAASFRSGAASAILGGAAHFLIAFTAAAVYYALSRRLDILVTRFILFGALYGIAVHVWMSFVVVPLTAVRKSPFVLSVFLTGLMVHIVCVGLPISLAVRKYSR